MFDYHIHSNFSDDGLDSMKTLAKAAIKVGLTQIAITDHYDPDYPDPTWSSDLDFASYHKQLEELTNSSKNEIKILKGLEIGIQHGKTLKKCTQAASAYPYDFILGSFHCAEGFELSCGGFFDNRTPEEATSAFYLYCHENIKLYDDFDVLGHINVVDRYSPYIPNSTHFIEIVRELLRQLIEKGKGIEFNTSSFRYGMGQHTTPTEEILRLYRDLGGEIITVGSDAHRASDIGSGIHWAYEKLYEIGYRYVTVYNQRQPEFISIKSLL